jgi:hypothetical protein
MTKGRQTQSDPARLTAAFVERLHNRFSSKYTLIGEYIDAKTSCKLLCECGREFNVKPDDLLYSGRGCDCAYWKARNESALRKVMPKPVKVPVWTEDKFLQRVTTIWGDEFEIISGFESIDAKVVVKHKTCGSVHDKYARSLIRNHGCQFCARNSMSSGVSIISNILDEWGLEYKREVKLEGCKLQRSLQFDFAVYNEDGSIAFLIEYDGEQHFRATNRMGGDKKLNLIQQRDRIKDSYCKRNGLTLVRINYMSVERKGDMARQLVSQQLAPFVEPRCRNLSNF